MMDEGQSTERGESSRTMSSSHDVPIRGSAPTQSSRTLEGSYSYPGSSNVPDASRQSSSDVWAGAIARIQTQVSMNTSMLESNRRQLQDVDVAVRNLNGELRNVILALRDLQAKVGERPQSAERPRHDPGDLELLARQIDAVTTKTNEVDGLKMQLELMRNRMKRLEDPGAQAASGMRLSVDSNHRESSMPEVTSTPIHQSPYAHPQGLPRQPLPPMRTSPVDSRPGSIHGTHQHVRPPILESQGGGRHYASPGQRHYSTESSAAMQASSVEGYRPGEALPPPSTLAGWRPTDAPPLAITRPLAPVPIPRARQHMTEPESPHASGWAAVNAAKRPLEENRASPYESPVAASPKRPKLAPIMPRSGYGDDASYVPSSMTQSAVNEYSSHSRGRGLSDASQSNTLPTPASASTPSYRFVTSTQNADSQESWRPEHERVPIPHDHTHHRSPRGRSRPRGSGRARGRGGRGGGYVPDSQELGTPDWEKADWTGSQISQNGFYHPLHHQHAQEEAALGGLVRRSGGVAGGPSDREHHDLPETPIQGPGDPFVPGHPGSDEQQTSGGKKTRTKPIRNAEGVLIRKDGRPDMRSVSSANNLRKVHAKKEAERAEMEGRTPVSARSLAPANSHSDEDHATRSGTPGSQIEGGEGVADQHDAQERHHELINRIFPRGMEGDADTRSTAERFFPRHEHQNISESAVKAEASSEERQEPQAHDNGASSQMTDVVMREMSEAQAEEHAQKDVDTKMPTVPEEADKEQEGEEGGGGTEQETAEQTAS